MHKYPVDHLDDIGDLLPCFAAPGNVPPFIPLKGQEQYNTDRIARQILEQRWTIIGRFNSAMRTGETKEAGRQAFFDFDAKSFLTEIMNARTRSLFQERFGAGDAVTEDRMY